MRTLAWVTSVALWAILLVRVAGAAGAPDTWVTAPLLGAFPWVVLAAVVAAVVAVTAALVGAEGLRAPAVTLVVAAAIGVVVLVPRATASTQPPADGATVTVAVVNARIGGADPAAVVRVARDEAVDLLAVVEGTPAFDLALRAAGIDTLLPADDVGPAGAVHAVGDVTPLRDGFPAGDTPDVLWSPPDAVDVVVTTLHATAPIGRVSTRSWADGIARTPPPENRVSIVLGDFNATVDHATFRSLLDQGWRDAAVEAGEGLSMTFDGLVDDAPALPMAIDHVLVSRSIAVLDVSTHDIEGTDHRMLVADLRLPAD